MLLFLLFDIQLELKKALILIFLLGQKLKTSAVPPNLAHINAPSLHTYYHTLSLDNGRNSRWALLKPLNIHRLVSPTFSSPFHTSLTTAIPPPAALWKPTKVCTPLDHQFNSVFISMNIIITFGGYVNHIFKFFWIF